MKQKQPDLNIFAATRTSSAFSRRGKDVGSLSLSAGAPDRRRASTARRVCFRRSSKRRSRGTSTLSTQGRQVPGSLHKYWDESLLSSRARIKLRVSAHRKEDAKDKLTELATKVSGWAIGEFAPRPDAAMLCKRRAISGAHRCCGDDYAKVNRSRNAARCCGPSPGGCLLKR